MTARREGEEMAVGWGYYAKAQQRRQAPVDVADGYSAGNGGSSGSVYGERK